ncbi:hypothetical protein [Acidithiobacillus ferrooxidans]|uniref:hypothetical protein n=1 Tax=Acidithiobacillus ferrooxidans TaxID=920 RepID=UPI000A4048D4|nr:hypothetical protein [Acidithiobacillus ferrooxidans]
MHNDIVIVEKSWNDLDVLVLDLMEMVRSHDDVINDAGLESLQEARSICKRLNILKKHLATSHGT